MIPKRFTGECEFCHDPIDIRDGGTHVFTEGWVQNRTGGGAHAIRMPKRHRRYACKWCVDKGSSGAGVTQMELFR